MVQVEAEEEDEVLDADTLERKRLREAEEWRLKQLRAGVSSEDNSNFQVPLPTHAVSPPDMPCHSSIEGWDI